MTVNPVSPFAVPAALGDTLAEDAAITEAMAVSLVWKESKA